MWPMSTLQSSFLLVYENTLIVYKPLNQPDDGTLGTDNLQRQAGPLK